MGVALAVVLLGALALIAYLATRRRGAAWRCRRCAAHLTQLDERAEDAHLDAGQQAEERAGSVDWVVRVCPACREVHVIEVLRWFSGNVICQGCKRRTGRAEHRSLRRAGWSQDGAVEVTTRCAHCDHVQRHTLREPSVMTGTRGSPPQRPASPRAGGPGRSPGSGDRAGGAGRAGAGRGGGHSGGGGAGSRW